MTVRIGEQQLTIAGGRRAGAIPLAEQFERVRACTLSLAQPLSAEDAALQSMPDASPAKWHLAHTTWFFETFVLEKGLPGYLPFHPQFRMLFNSYYMGVGPRHPRPERGLLSRPSLDEVHAYRRHVDTQVMRLLSDSSLSPALSGLIELGIQHEQQHQELIVTDLKHLFWCNPLRPAYTAGPAVAPARAGTPLRWLERSEGLFQIGHYGPGFSFDNERPRHRVYVDRFAIASRPVTNAEYALFIADRGYDTPEWWLAEGWDVKNAQGWHAPLYWEKREGQWQAFTLRGMQPLVADAPVCHVSFFEADAYARWARARLPTEAEWEIVAAAQPVDGNFLDSGCYQPVASVEVPGSQPAALQFFGDVWEWTRSSYQPYAGYHPQPGAVGEYNGKFMANQYVLRGGSCATPASHVRASYRNFFPAVARWQFSGIRLARDHD